jgi:hypothetical protein
MKTSEKVCLALAIIFGLPIVIMVMHIMPGNTDSATQTPTSNYQIRYAALESNDYNISDVKLEQRWLTFIAEKNEIARYERIEIQIRYFRKDGVLLDKTYYPLVERPNQKVQCEKHIPDDTAFIVFSLPGQPVNFSEIFPS